MSSYAKKVRARKVTTSLSQAVKPFISKLPDMSHLGLGEPQKRNLRGYQKRLQTSRDPGPKGGYDKDLIDLMKQFQTTEERAKTVSEVAYLDSITDEDGHRFTRGFYEYRRLSDQLVRVCEKSHPNLFGKNQHYRKSLEEMKAEYRGSLKPLRYQSDADIRESIPKGSTHSGFLAIITGKIKKVENMEGIYKLYSNEERKALESGSFNRPTLIAHRTQASGEYDDDGNRTGTFKLKVRLIRMVCLILIIAGLRFAKPFIEMYSKRRIYAGGKDDFDIRESLDDLRSRFSYWVSIDYSSYDQTISDWLIRDAFSVIKGAFEMDDLSSKLFSVIEHDFIHQRAILAEGMIVSSKGVPSGDMFTQVVDSIVNELVIRSYLSSRGLKGEMVLMGDDNLIFTRDEIDIQDLSSWVKHNFGLVISPDKSKRGTSAKDPHFLSRVWTAFGPTRNWNQVLSRMAFPERRREYDAEVQPADVLWSYALTYRCVREHVDLEALAKSYPEPSKEKLAKVDARYVPGIVAYMRDYLPKYSRAA